MDILSRLKIFMESRQISSSQFADKCGIPRPTVSQILSGRNKKISDELITKIHAAYPGLSILWLMFGEGVMEFNRNIEISEPQNAPHLTFDDSQSDEHEMFGSRSYRLTDARENVAEKSKRSQPMSPDLFSIPSEMQIEQSKAEEPQKPSTKESVMQKLSLNDDASKKITSIVVFYADSTFETFSPSNI